MISTPFSCLYLIGQRLVQVGVYIQHIAAVQTDKMRVLGDIPVKTLLPVDDPDRDHKTLLLENGDVPVDGAQAQIG